LSSRLKRVDGVLVLEVDDTGVRLPAGGMVLPWPLDGAPGATTVDGAPAEWEARDLRIRALPARVEVALPRRGPWPRDVAGRANPERSGPRDPPPGRTGATARILPSDRKREGARTRGPGTRRLRTGCVVVLARHVTCACA